MIHVTFQDLMNRFYQFPYFVFYIQKLMMDYFDLNYAERSNLSVQNYTISVVIDNNYTKKGTSSNLQILNMQRIGAFTN